MRREQVNTGTVWEDIAGYSRAIRIGDRILVSGTTATDEDGEVAGHEAGEQAEFILNKIERAIVQLGGTMNDVVRTRIYLRYTNDWEEVSRAHGARFGKVRPANTLVEAKLVGDEYLVEIEAEAIVGAGDAI